MSEQNTLTVLENSCNREDEDTKDLLTEDESGVLFYVNKDGFPIKEKTWERMWQHVEKIHPKGPQIAQSIRDNQKLDKVKFIAFECHKRYQGEAGVIVPAICMAEGWEVVESLSAVVTFLRMRSFGMIWMRINDPRLLESWADQRI